MPSICILCGKTVPRLYEHLCEACFAEKHIGKVRIPANIDIEICAECGANLFKGHWRKTARNDDMIVLAVKDGIRCPKELEFMEPDISLSWEDPRNVLAEVHVMVKRDRIQTQIPLSTRVRLKKNLCPTCSRQRGKYYEAVLQVRGTRASEVAQIVENDIRLAGSKAFISKMAEVKGGIDAYLSDMNAAKQIARELCVAFGGEYGESAKLYGIREGKEVYRMTYLIRLPEYRRGDFLLIDGRLYRLVEFRKKEARVFNFSSGRMETLERKLLNGAKILGGDEIIKEAVILSVSDRELQILDPETYRTVTLTKPVFFKKVAESAKIVSCEAGIFIVE